MTVQRNAFFAYTSEPFDLRETINAAVKDFNSSQEINLRAWEANDISGRPLVNPILAGIDKSEFIVADITSPNPNVSFEIGYALGAGKRCLLVLNSTFETDNELVSRIGIYDTLGYKKYSTSDVLSSFISQTTDKEPIHLDPTLNSTAPVYVVEPPVRDDAFAKTVSAIKKARWRYRSFSPSEDIRLSASDGIRNVSQSAGVVVSIIDDNKNGSIEHNIRSCFVAGIAYALNKPLLILARNSTKLPTDIKDIAKNYSTIDNIKSLIHDLSLEINQYQQDYNPGVLEIDNILHRIDVGDPTAENEMATLGGYYVVTDPYKRAINGNVNLVTGRKGSGKTALFIQVRDKVRRNRNNIVVDLRPEGYQLIKVKEKILDFLSEGSKQHLITTFWEYILLTEIARKMIEKDEQRRIFDEEMKASFDKLKSIYEGVSFVDSGDFSERIDAFADYIIGNYEKKGFVDNEVKLNQSEITELLHKYDLKDLFDAVTEYMEFKEECWVLFDNLDKGWSVGGVSRDDMFVLRCLIDACKKLERDMRKRSAPLHSIVFVRDDVFALLLEASADYGKEMRAKIDWSDRVLLGELLDERIATSLELDKKTDTKDIWPLVAVSHMDGEPTRSYLVERSLMRPRNLLKLFRHCLASAVNRNHAKIKDTDIISGFESYSMDLITEIDRELSDVAPEATNVLYEFLDENRLFSEAEIKSVIRRLVPDDESIEKVIDYLLYYGVLGIEDVHGESKYIYDYSYNMKLIRGRLKKAGNNAKFVVNIALWPALGLIDQDSLLI
jgi:hypothetical protein